MRKLLTIALALAAIGCAESPPAGSSGASGPPLLVYLHGYGHPGAGQGAAQDAIQARAEAEGWRFIAPPGFRNEGGALYWPASAACCDIYGDGLDGVERVWDAIRDADPTGPVFVVGLSNGGFMAHRMACDAVPGEIAAAVSIAGAGTCAFEIHGRADVVVPFEGGAVWGINMGPAPAAYAAPKLWAGPWGHEIPPSGLEPMWDYLRAAL
jgi:polyhydroxybutyrate depolymerase